MAPFAVDHPPPRTYDGSMPRSFSWLRRRVVTAEPNPCPSMVMAGGGGKGFNAMGLIRAGPSDATMAFDYNQHRHEVFNKMRIYLLHFNSNKIGT